MISLHEVENEILFCAKRIRDIKDEIANGVRLPGGREYDHLHFYSRRIRSAMSMSEQLGGSRAENSHLLTELVSYRFQDSLQG